MKDLLGADENARILAAGRMRLHTVGDTGNSKYGADAQDSVAYHMEQQLAPTETDGCSFFYHLGDVVYFSASGGTTSLSSMSRIFTTPRR